MVADTKYEIPVAFGVAQASRAETKELELDKLFEEAPLLAERCKDFSADRGLDGGPAKLRDRYGIRPLHAPLVGGREERHDPDNRSSTTTREGR